MTISFPSFFLMSWGKRRDVPGAIFLHSLIHTHTGQKKKGKMCSWVGPQNSHAFLPGMRELFPHFIFLALTQKKEWRSQRVTVSETIHNMFRYTFDCSYYHNASSIFTVGKIYVLYCNIKNNYNKQ